MKHFAILALSALCLAACTAQSETETEEKKDGLIQVPMPMAEGYVDFDSLYVIEKIVMPEVTEQSVIKNPHRAFWVAEDSVLVVFSKGNQQISVFAADGKFLNNVGAHGSGDGQYSEVSDIVVNRGKVFVFDNAVQKMLVYGLDGQLLNTIDSKFSFRSFAKADNGFWLYACHRSNNEGGYALIHADEALQDTIACYFPQHPDFVNVEHRTNFVIHSDKAYFFWPTSNVIYLLKGNDVTPYATVDFGKNTPNYVFLARQEKLNSYETYMEEGKYYRFRNVHICGDFVTLVYRRYAVSDVVQTNFAYYNRKSGHCVASPLKYASVNRLIASSYNIGESDDFIIMQANVAHDDAVKKYVLESYGIQIPENANPLFILGKPVLK